MLSESILYMYMYLSDFSLPPSFPPSLFPSLPLSLSSSMLFERRIIITSSSLKTVSTFYLFLLFYFIFPLALSSCTRLCIITIPALLVRIQLYPFIIINHCFFPFNRQHIFIPITPHHLIDYCT